MTTKLGRYRLLKTFFAFFVFLLIAITGETKQVSPPKSKEQLWDETIKQAEELRTIEQDFRADHQFKDKLAQPSIQKLRAEGFQCSLKYKILPTFKKGNDDGFASENVPMIYCSKAHKSEDTYDLCKTFWAAFEINWKNSEQDPELLQKELESSTIKNETYFCRASEDKDRR